MTLAFRNPLTAIIELGLAYLLCLDQLIPAQLIPRNPSLVLAIVLPLPILGLAPIGFFVDRCIAFVVALIRNKK